MADKHEQKYALYTDDYFDRGHWEVKIRETLVGGLAWLGVLIPIVVAFLAVFEPNFLHLNVRWSRNEGIFQLKYIGLILLFAFIMVVIFTVSMTIIQNHKRQHLVEQWPTYNPINQSKRKVYLERFMTDRFGSAKKRMNVRYYRVRPEQNIETDELQRILSKNHVNDL